MNTSTQNKRHFKLKRSNEMRNANQLTLDEVNEIKKVEYFDSNKLDLGLSFNITKFEDNTQNLVDKQSYVVEY
jgi:hypothetical protein